MTIHCPFNCHHVTKLKPFSPQQIVKAISIWADIHNHGQLFASEDPRRHPGRDRYVSYSLLPPKST